MSTTHKPDGTMPSDAKKWTVAIAWASFLLIPSFMYASFLTGEPWAGETWAAITAAVASFLFATSLSASSVSYYLGWPNMRKGYQKQIGVLAFWLSVIYCLQLSYLYPETYVYGFFENLHTPDFIFGLSAMAIFATMTFANSKFMSPYLSWDTIKFILGLGFVGYALLVIRAVFIEWPLWEAWLTSFEGFPPGRLVLSAVAMVVLLLRVSVMISRSRNPR